jgi:hypothetical protein
LLLLFLLFVFLILRATLLGLWTFENRQHCLKALVRELAAVSLAVAGLDLAAVGFGWPWLPACT